MSPARIGASFLLLSCLVANSSVARAEISRYSQVKVTPLKGTGASAGQAIGFKLKLVLHSAKPEHQTAWVGLVSPFEQLKMYNIKGEHWGKGALYNTATGHWHKSWTVENLRPGIPSEQEFTVLYRDNPQLVPGNKYQLNATFPLKGDAPEAWKHTFGAVWGHNDWGEPSIELPK
jgi:hypothetical protein